MTSGPFSRWGSTWQTSSCTLDGWRRLGYHQPNCAMSWLIACAWVSSRRSHHPRKELFGGLLFSSNGASPCHQHAGNLRAIAELVMLSRHCLSQLHSCQALSNALISVWKPHRGITSTHARTPTRSELFLKPKARQSIDPMLASSQFRRSSHNN